MIPEAFLTRMKNLLGDGYDAFVTALESPPERAFRLNPLKVENGADVLSALADYHPEKLPYEQDGYRFAGEKIGNTPAHHAGAVYVQDPGAMAALPAVTVNPGDLVIDFCASPGGKSSQIAARQKGQGILLSNEYVPARAATLVGNFERLGIRNAVVTSLDTAVLADLYPDTFDLAVVDAPCSGEGMFRKCDDAVSDWNEGNVRMCAERQAVILDNAAKTVKPGGKLLYSTCTYSPEEDEWTVDAFLRRHPDFSLIPPNPEVVAVTASGIRFSGLTAPHIEFCRRFYPHVSRGEGQFFAVLRKSDGAKAQPPALKNNLKLPSKEQKTVIDDFLRSTVKHPQSYPVFMLGEKAVVYSAELPPPPFGVFSVGVTLGEIKGKTLVPHHHFYTAFGRDFLRAENLTEDDARLFAYLHGEEIATDLDGGFCAVLYRGIPLGGGKVSGGRLKNHYPKGLRKQ